MDNLQAAFKKAAQAASDKAQPLFQNMSDKVGEIIQLMYDLASIGEKPDLDKIDRGVRPHLNEFDEMWKQAQKAAQEDPQVAQILDALNKDPVLASPTFAKKVDNPLSSSQALSSPSVSASPQEIAKQLFDNWRAAYKKAAQAPTGQAQPLFQEMSDKAHDMLELIVDLASVGETPDTNRIMRGVRPHARELEEIWKQVVKVAETNPKAGQTLETLDGDLRAALIHFPELLANMSPKYVYQAPAKGGHKSKTKPPRRRK